ncbi:MAG: CHASE3 domain-containing protein [Thermostichus sp. HHBFW_bins_43]
MKKLQEPFFLNVGFSVALALLAAGAGLSLFESHQLARREQWVRHTHAVLENLEFLLLGLKEAESGQRGYILTGQPQQLEAYDAGIRQVQIRREALRALTLDNPLQQERLDAVERQIEQRLENLNRSVALYGDNPEERAVQATLTEEGSTLQEAVETILLQMEDTERALLAQRSQVASHSIQRTTVAVLLTSLTGISLLVGVYLLLRRQDWQRRRWQAQLQAAHDGLEQLVKQRTAELASTLEALQSSEHQYRQLFQANPMPMWLADPDSLAFWDVNEAAIRQYGYDRAEFLGMTLRDLELPGSHPQNVLGTDLGLSTWHRRKDGTCLEVEMTSHEVQMEGRRGSLTLARDVTELRRAQESLQRTLRALSDLKYAIDEAAIVATTDAQGTITDVNDRFCQIAQYSRAELIGQSHRLINSGHHDKAFFRQMWSTISRGHIWKGEICNRAKDGSLYWVDTVIVPFLDDQNKPWQYLAIRFEITNRKQVEAEIRQLNQTLEQRVEERTLQLELANRELEAFSYSVSHDLRAPLRSIDGFGQALLEDYNDQLDAVGQDYLRRIRAATQRMGQLIDDLLMLSRVTRSELKRDWVNLSQLAHGIAQELEQSNPQRSVLWSIEPDLMAYGDPRLLRVVLENLLDNAWKFTAKQPQAHIEVGSHWQDHERIYFVRDNGAGFDMHYADKLFGPFQRLHPSEDYAGTGIGLATVQRIIHRHGGHIGAEAALGKGAIFSFTLGGE